MTAKERAIEAVERARDLCKAPGGVSELDRALIRACLDAAMVEVLTIQELKKARPGMGRKPRTVKREEFQVGG